VRAVGGLLVAGLALLATGVACSSSSAPSSAAPPRTDAGGVTPDASTDSNGPPPSLDSGTAPPADAGAGDAPSIDASGILASRPYTLHVPSGYDATKATPL